MTPLPTLMVAPNGARLGKKDHPALPVSLPEIVQTAAACAQAGAEGIHIHLRDKNGGHILDAGQYREALAEIQTAVPGLACQITTESVGLYSSAHQRQIALTSGAKLVSTSIREIMTDTDMQTAKRFFDACRADGINLQFIIYDLADVALLRASLRTNQFFDPGLQILFVLGRYSTNRDSDPADLQPFFEVLASHDWSPDWAVCAFGKGETKCLQSAFRHGGKLRVGFENSTWAADGTIARDNAQRVAEIADLMIAQKPAA